MRRILKRTVSFFLVPFTRWYLRKKRKHQYKNIEVTVFPGVFHPGFFSSTHFLLKHLESQNVSRKQFLELGSGTGLISVWASLQGADVLSSDLSAKAVANTTYNAKQLGLSIPVIQSDLFDRIDHGTFDWIVINPPYYARPITSEDELAWHCGENLEYFERLFASLNDHIDNESQVLMILTQESCDIASIFEMADKQGFYFELIRERTALLDGKDFLFRIRRTFKNRSEDQA
jgi:release factor glutamine methyltransferase